MVSDGGPSILPRLASSYCGPSQLAHPHLFSFSPFLPFAAVSLCGVAGLANIFPSLTVSGPFLPDTPRFHVPPDRILPPQIWSSSRAPPSIFISTTALLFSVSSLLLTWPNYSSLLLLITVAICSTFTSSKISSFLRCSNRPTPIAHRTIVIYVVAVRLSYLSDADVKRILNVYFCWRDLPIDDVVKVS